MKTRRQSREAAKIVFDGCGSGQCLTVVMDNGEGGGGDR